MTTDNPEPHGARRDRLRTVVAERGFDAVLVTSLVNVRYLSGFTGSNAALLVAPEPAGDLLATDSRYGVAVGEQAPDLPVLIERAAAVALLAAAARRRARRIGYESHVVTVDELHDLHRADDSIELSSSGPVVESLRAVKDAAEIDALRRACAIADSAFAGLLDSGRLRAGRTERAVAVDLDRRMVDLGAAAPSYDTIVAAGENAASAHHTPGERELTAGDLVVCDFGATYAGYHSDMTRTVAVGEPARWQRDLYDLVARAQRAGCAAAVWGARAVDVDHAARSIIAEAGHGKAFGHGLGHGVGLLIHEAPSLGPTAAGTLEARMTVTVEPGVYLLGRAGVRIEDLLVVADGPAEILTRTGKDLISLPGTR